ncbi:uncharacterized protein LOC135224513 [Macrobrachium nipponense]|uniref:uncharacterized protein LOC135224513 n=1 Tax=Macrobrachium nipponense TaxID=159736 RepID=UPI0030C7D85B
MDIKMWRIFFIAFFIIGTESEVVFPSDECDIFQRKFCQCFSTNITCDCEGQSMTLEGPQPNIKDKIIAISNCKRLSILPGSLRNAGPIRMILSNISHLDLTSSSFQMDSFDHPRIYLRIINTTIDKLASNTFTTENKTVGPEIPLLKISMENTTINVLQAKTFGNFVIDSMSFINSSVSSIFRYAIFNVVRDKLKIINTKFTTVAKNAINLQGSAHELHVEGNIFIESLPLFLNGTIGKDVYIINNVFPDLQQSPWNLLVNNEVYLINNTFKNIPTRGLNVKVKKRITLKNNIVKRLEENALQSLMPLSRSTEIFFTGNTLLQHDFKSLCLSEEFDIDNVYIRNNLFQQDCSCNFTTEIATGLGERNATLEVLYEDKVHQQWLLQNKCILHGIRVSIDSYLVQSCLKTTKMTSVLVISSVAIFFTVTISVIVVWRCVKHKRFIQTSDADYQSFSVPAPSSMGQTPWSLVQPDPRTYQEVEIHILFQKAEEIQDPEEQDGDEKTQSDLNDRGIKDRLNSNKMNADPSMPNDSQTARSKDLTEHSKYQKDTDTLEKNSQVRQSCPAFS